MPRAFKQLVRLLRRATLWVALGTHSVAAHAQQADDPSQLAARALGYAGIDAYEAGDFETAAQRLEAAYTALRVPSLGLWSARALQQRGRWVAAEQRLREVKQLPLAAGELQIQRQAQVDTATELELLQAKLPRLTIRLLNAAPNEVRVTLDGQQLDVTALEALPVDPGEHKLLGSKAAQNVEAAVTLAPNERREVNLSFSAPPPAPSPAPTAAPQIRDSDFVHDTLPWVLIGVGGAVLATGGVTFALALSDNAEIEENPNCEQRRCLASESQLVSHFKTLNTVSGVTLVAGGLLTVSGVVLWVVNDSDSRPTRVQVGPSSLWLTGTF